MPAPNSSSASARTKASTQSRRSSAGSGAKQPGQPGGTNGLASLVEQLTNSVIKPLDLVMLSRDRIQDTLDEAAERGRLTRSDANELVSELVRRGREQTDSVLERLIRSAGRVRRTVGGEPPMPILAYDDLTARQATERLKGLTPAELRTVRDYERRHANRKSVLAAIDRALDK
jgi:polyhydroxyalkanoate synthesis regulator phasin